MEYDGAFAVHLPVGSKPKPGWAPPFLGNGRLSLYPAWMNETRIDNYGAATFVDDGKNGANVSSRLSQTFRAGLLRVGRRTNSPHPPSTDASDVSDAALADEKQRADAVPHDVRYNLISSSLDLSTATFRQSYSALETRTGRNLVTLESSVTPLRQFPTCSLQSVRLTAHPDQLLSDGGFSVFHGAVPPPDVVGVEYEASAVSFPTFRRSLRTEQQTSIAAPLDVFSGQGVSVHDETDVVAFASCYLWHDHFSKMAYRGLAAAKDDDGGDDGYGVRARYARSDVCYPQKGDVAGYGKDELDSVVVDVLTCHLHGQNKEACRAVLASIVESHLVASGDDHRACGERLRRGHEARWKEMWESDVDVELQYDVAASCADSSTVPPHPGALLQRGIRFCLYDLYASVTTASDSVSDAGVPGAACRLLWTTPLLLFLHPPLGRAMIERAFSAYKTMLTDVAKTGIAYVPLLNPIGAPTPPLRFFEGAPGAARSTALRTPSHVVAPPDCLVALLAINAWDYFRTTLDDMWLAEHGFELIATCADYLSSQIELYGHDREVITFNDADDCALPRRVRDHTLTEAASLLAFEFATEAARLLRAEAKSVRWKAHRTDLAELFAIGSGDASLTVALHAGHNFANDDEQIADVMATFTPLMSRVWKHKRQIRLPSYDDEDPDAGLVTFFTPAEPRVFREARRQNQRMYDLSAPVRSDGLQHPYNLAWRAMTYGQEMRRAPEQAETALAALDDLFVSLGGGVVDDAGSAAGVSSFIAGDLFGTFSVWPNTVRRDCGDASTVFDGEGLRSSAGFRNAGRTSDRASAAAVFLYAFLVTMCGIRAQGEIGEDNFVHEEFKNDVFKGRTVLPCIVRRILLFVASRKGRGRANVDAHTRLVVNNGVTTSPGPAL